MRTCIFYDADPVYRVRFLSYVRRREEAAITVREAADEAECLALAQDADALLTAEAIWKGWNEEARSGLSEAGVLCLLLTEEEAEQTGDGVLRLCRYQPASRIVEALEEGLSDRGEPSGLSAREAVCIGVYAPLDTGSRTGYALSLAHREAREHSVLFVSLLATPSFTAGTEEEGGGLSELLYRYRTEGQLHWRASLAHRVGDLTVLTPAANPEDLWELSSRELAGLLRELLLTGAAELVVAELPAGIDPLPLFGVCDELRILHEDTVDGRRGAGRFRAWLHRAAGSELLARCREEAVSPMAELTRISAGDPLLRYAGEGVGEL